MNTFFKGLLGFIGVLLLIPIAIVAAILIIITLVGGYIEVVLTLVDWAWIVIGLIALLILARIVCGIVKWFMK